jgi:hypothetical protein
MNLLISEVSILSLYSESGISRIFFICSRNSFASLSLTGIFFSSFTSSFFSSLSDFLSFFSSFLFSLFPESSGQKTLSNIESIQLFFFCGLDSSVSFHEISEVHGTSLF